MMARRVVAVALLSLLIFPLATPVSAEWEEDAWLSNIIGPERLSLGDEFGCHGMPVHDSSSNNTEINSCRDYLTNRINASKWGSEPISYGVDSGKNDQTYFTSIRDAGFLLIDSNEDELIDTHHGLSVINYNGGSLEKNIGSKQQFDDALESGSDLVNFFWMARDHDVIVRPETELIESIESTNAWFTTWGEHYSYRSIYGNFSVIDNDLGYWDVEFNNEDTESWLVPVTSSFKSLGANVVSVEDEFNFINELESNEPHLKEGWRQEGNTLFLTLYPNKQVRVNFDRSEIADVIQEPCENFNGHNFSITVAGHHTNDLFDWSRRWDDSIMRFTWLIEPRELDGFSWFLPSIAVFLALAAPVAIIYLVKTDRRAQQMVSVFDSLDGVRFGEE
ncbi:MAG: hypothetical protein CMA77_05040 [Euryarchaeota archaeon]|nr:hypothetical protein [Euryarchaeota archaeon]